MNESVPALEGNWIALLPQEMKQCEYFPKGIYSMTSVTPHRTQSLASIINCDCSSKEATTSQTTISGW